MDTEASYHLLSPACGSGVALPEHMVVREDLCFLSDEPGRLLGLCSTDRMIQSPTSGPFPRL